jgi:predicted metal-dependent enzyme (double-stranded beta helix superfamily)
VFAVPPNTVALPGQRAAAHPVLIAREFAFDRDRWRHLLRYDPRHRWSALVERTDDHEVWLLSWLPGQRTGLHDHGGAAGALTVVSGTLTERVARVEPDGRAVEVVHEVRAAQSRVFGPNHVHQVSNDGADPAVSVHVYRPARHTMTPYRFDPVHGPLPLG